MRRWLSALGIALVLAIVIVILVDAAGFLQHWISYHSGSCNQTSDKACNPVYYNWWSGPGSDLGEVTLITAILTPAVIAARHRNCMERGCWRLTGQEVVDDRTHVKHRLCHKHHPCIPDEHARHGIFRNHMTSEYLDEIKAHHVAMNPPTREGES